MTDALEYIRPNVGLFPWKGVGNMNAKIVDGHRFLFHVCAEGIHNVDDAGYGGHTVMSDDARELRRHLEAVHYAKGRVLKTGLGFGCFVRMCLAKPEVDHIDVVENNKSIIDHFGKEFEGNPRVTIHHADAFDFSLKNGPWDFAWHDIYCAGNDGLQKLHVKLILRYQSACRLQGAWMLERYFRKLLNGVI